MANASRASAGNLSADLGVEVTSVEPPGAASLRAGPGYRFIGRSKKSIVLDLHDMPEADLAFRRATDAGRGA